MAAKAGIYPTASKIDAVRLFAGFAGLGAALVDFSIASSVIAAGGTAAPTAELGQPLVLGQAAGAAIWGAALVVWSLTTLYRGRLLWPRVALPLLVGAAAVHLAVLGWEAAAGGGFDLSQLAALLLTLMLVSAAGWLKRCGQSHGAGQAEGSPGRLVLAAFAGAVLVAAVATPGLAASAAGRSAVPHGGHRVPGVGMVPGMSEDGSGNLRNGHHKP